MNTIRPMEKVAYARAVTAMMRSEDREELREYAANMRDCAAKMEAKARELDKRAEWARENNQQKFGYR